MTTHSRAPYALSDMDSSRLRSLDDRKPVWRRPDDEVVNEVIIPSLQVADRFDCMVGYFGGSALRELSHGLATYILRSEQPLRLLVSPVLSTSDQEAIRLGTRAPKEILTEAIKSAFTDEIALASALAQHTRQCFAYLLSTRRLLMKVVIVQEAVFHLKEWIFQSDHDIAVLSGSANFTGAALLGNVERLNLYRSWRGGDNEAACRDAVQEFEAYWSNSKLHAIAVDLPIALREGLVKSYDTTYPPTEADYRKALDLEGKLQRDKANTPVGVGITQRGFAPPPDLVWETGRYAHQATAVLRWEGAGRNGILAMATGSGKTIAALLCAWYLWRELRRLVVVVAAPTRPLVAQWADECRNFGLVPYVSGSDERRRRLREVDERLQSIELGLGSVEALVVTNDFLNDAEFRTLIDGYQGPMMLIADEVHNLGAGAFLSAPPLHLPYRLGLSATPERQYDPEGSTRLTEFFGKVIFEFNLADAIGVCLVPYNYYIHNIALSHSELDQYRQISNQIRRLARIAQPDPSKEYDQRLQLLLNRRRLILETASAKLETLRDLLVQGSASRVRHTLVYATDKDPDQIRDVNRIIRSLDLRFHQITAQETANAKLVDSVLDAFRQGSLHVLTAKRVLDEGLDVPEISNAIILASTTVERQWVQRRGRVLRMCPAISKEHATIHDFLVLPPPDELGDDDVKRLIRGELARCDEFASLAQNRASQGGPQDVLQDARLHYIV